MMMSFGEAERGWRLDDPGRAAGVQVLVIADGAARGEAEAVVRAIDGRLLGTVAWRDAPARLEQQGSVGMVLAEAGGAEDAAVASALPHLDALARGGDSHVIVTLDVAQIDLVTATLAAPAIDLLCAPSIAERFAAVSLASIPRRERASDIGRDAEATRLRRLNAEVARIAETLTRLTRAEAEDGAIIVSVGDRPLGYAAPPIVDPVDIAPRTIRDAIRTRRLRDQFFGNGLFEDPAWDMLLDLFAAELERTQVSVSSLCIAAAVAPTTALRWIARMTEAGLFERQPDPFDRRRAFMALSDAASGGMRAYVAAAGRAGLGMA